HRVGCASRADRACGDLSETPRVAVSELDQGVGPHSEGSSEGSVLTIDIRLAPNVNSEDRPQPPTEAMKSPPQLRFAIPLRFATLTSAPPRSGAVTFKL